MTEPAPASASEPPAPVTKRRAPRTRVIVARILTVLGIVLLVVSLLANFVKREALDKEHFRNTAAEMIANDTIRDQVAAAMVESLYANVDVSSQLKDQLPKNLKSLSGPIAGIAREAADRGAREVLERPRVQSLFVNLASTAQQELVKVLDNKTELLDTTNGNVVLDIRPLILQLGERFQVVDNLDQRIPQDAGKVTLLRSDQLSTAQNLTQWLKAVADWIWVLVILCWAAAVWLVPDRRRREIRAIGAGIAVAGLLLLVIRSVAGNYIVDKVVATDTVKPAVHQVWEIVTDSLSASAWNSIAVGLIAVLGAWLCGPARAAVAARRELAPRLRRPEIAWPIFALVLVLLLWILPIQNWTNGVIVIVLAVIGFEVFRRQVLEEAPHDPPSALVAGVRGAVVSVGQSFSRPAPSRTEELERLARLHESGALSDEEFAAAKAELIPPTTAT